MTLPRSEAELGEAYGDAFASLGYELSPATLLEGPSGTYNGSGHHLALYVEPLDPLTPDDYARGIWDLTALVAPDVFERWPELDSFDICQEQTATGPPSLAPDTVTQVFMDRRSVDHLNWRRGNLEDLWALDRSSDEVRVTVNEPASTSGLLPS